MLLKEFRKELGITQKELADELSISIPQISRYESGETAMTPDTIIKLCDYLGITADQLLGHIPSTSHPPSNSTDSQIKSMVFNSTLEQAQKHFSFLENKLLSCESMLEASKNYLDLMLLTEEKISTELNELKKHYLKLQTILNEISQYSKIT